MAPIGKLKENKPSLIQSKPREAQAAKDGTIRKTLFEISSVASIELIGMCNALQYVDVKNENG